jgi:hypothetical protein
MTNKKQKLILDSLIKEFTHIFGPSIFAKLLATLEVSYDDMIEIGVAHQDAIDALITPKDEELE